MKENERVLPVEKLENILAFMPVPAMVFVDFYGFNDSALLEQAREIMPEATLETESTRHIFRLNQPSKEKILAIYRRFYGKTSISSKDHKSPGLELQSIHWNLDEYTSIVLTPNNVQVKCLEQEPECVMRLRQELVRTYVNLEIKVENYQHQ